jgi:gamma-glutamylcyclotransferase (GGCT)/AIG2-like uncharacterized protein YtfP
MRVASTARAYGWWFAGVLAPHANALARRGRTAGVDLFVYGTLTAPGRVATLVDAYVFVGPARVEGLHPVEGRHPTLAPGGTGAGRLLRIDDDDVAAVDDYEGAPDLYVRVPIPLAGGDAVHTYVGDPAALGVADEVAWPGEGTLDERVRRYVADAEVVVRPIDS